MSNIVHWAWCSVLCELAFHESNRVHWARCSVLLCELAFHESNILGVSLWPSGLSGCLMRGSSEILNVSVF